MACNESSYVALGLLLVETICTLKSAGNFEIGMLIGFWATFALSAFSVVVTSKGLFIIPEPYIESVAPFIYLFDPLLAVILGWSIYDQNIFLCWFCFFLLSNGFYLHILSKIFVAKKPKGLHDDFAAMLKNFIHHLGSFVFLSNVSWKVILLTSLWRCISMSGHSVQTANYKKWISPEQLNAFNWKLSHIRNLFVAILLFCCYWRSDIRSGFGLSAIGHISYILVRAGPVFRLGSVYVGDRMRWQSLSDWQRFQELLEGKHMYLTLEVGSLMLVSGLFLYWRLSFY